MPRFPTFTYDGENRLVDYGNGTGKYSFDGNSLRVKREAQGSTTVYIFNGSQVIDERAGGAADGAVARVHLFRRTAGKIENSTTNYYPDHLSTRMTMAGATTTQQGHYPFGESWYGSSEKWKFTSYARDTETGNDYAIFRSYVNRYGRFLTPDPAGLGAVSVTNPQTWNRYAYGRNNPILRTDAFGLKDNIVCTGKPGKESCTGSSSSIDVVAEAVDVEYLDSLLEDQSFLPEIPSVDQLDSDSGSPGEPEQSGKLVPASLPLPTKPCAGKSAGDLDYKTKRWYWSEGKYQTPLEHIMEGHVLWNAPPGNTKYVSNSQNPWVIMGMVVAENQATFALDPLPSKQGNGNVRFTLFYPEIRVITPVGIFTRKGIGQDESGNWLHTNVLIVEPNCKTVVTSYPTRP